MFNTEIIEHLGISKRSAIVYMTCLSLGTASVKQIAEKSGMKRPTVYLHLEELMKEGLIVRIPLGKKDYFQASEPQVLLQRAEKEVEKLKEHMPNLMSLQNERKGLPSVKVLSGKAGMNIVYEEITRANSIRFWTDLSVFEKAFADMFEEVALATARNQIRSREIIADTVHARMSSKRYSLIAGKTYSSRVATVEGIGDDNAIYGDVVALFRIEQYNLYVVRIQDASIARSMKAMFDMAWMSAKQFIN